MRSLQAWIFDGWLTVWVLVLPNLYMEYIIFIMVCLSYVRVIITFMRVSLVELLHQAVMGRVPPLEYMISGARGLLQPRPIVSGAPSQRFMRPHGW
jgi:hypothetical protein